MCWKDSTSSLTSCLLLFWGHCNRYNVLPRTCYDLTIYLLNWTDSLFPFFHPPCSYIFHVRCCWMYINHRGLHIGLIIRESSSLAGIPEAIILWRHNSQDYKCTMIDNWYKCIFLMKLEKYYWYSDKPRDVCLCIWKVTCVAGGGILLWTPRCIIRRKKRKYQKCGSAKGISLSPNKEKQPQQWML